MSINFVDIILVIVVLLSAYNGYRRGFILGLLDLLGWALVLITGLRFYQPVAKWLGDAKPASIAIPEIDRAALERFRAD